MKAVPVEEIEKLRGKDRLKAEVLGLIQKGELKTVEIPEQGDTHDRRK